MANRAMNAKFERAKRQGREAAWMEYSKAGYTIEKSDGQALIELLASRPDVTEIGGRAVRRFKTEKSGAMPAIIAMHW